MPYNPTYEELEWTRADLANLEGPTVIEFGANWCGICRGFAPTMQRLLAEHPEVRHVKVEDGPGKPFGRSFRVKLWPTLVLLRDGQVISQVARPSAAQAAKEFEAITSPAQAE